MGGEHCGGALATRPSADSARQQDGTSPSQWQASVYRGRVKPSSSWCAKKERSPGIGMKPNLKGSSSWGGAAWQQNTVQESARAGPATGGQQALIRAGAQPGLTVGGWGGWSAGPPPWTGSPAPAPTLRGPERLTPHCPQSQQAPPPLPMPSKLSSCRKRSLGAALSSPTADPSDQISPLPRTGMLQPPPTRRPPSQCSRYQDY